jgi:hypothetical protein
MTTDDNSPPSQTCGLLFLFLWLFGVCLCLFPAHLLGVFNFTRWHFGGDFLFMAWEAVIVLIQGFLLFDVARDCIGEKREASELMLRLVFASIGMPLIAFGGCLFLWNIK